MAHDGREELDSPIQREESSLSYSVVKYQQELHSGPLPHPIILAEYERIVPGSAERIMALAERQTSHRISMESAVIGSDIARSKLGLWLGFIVSVLTIIASAALVGLGHDVAGTTIATSLVVALTSVFVYGTAIRRSERRENAKRDPPPSEAAEE